jgi:hypothetical protein
MDLDLRKFPGWLVVVLAGLAFLTALVVFLFLVLCIGPLNAAVGGWMAIASIAYARKYRHPRRTLLH